MFFSYLLLTVATFTFLAEHGLVTSSTLPEKVYYDLDLSAHLFDQFLLKHQKKYTAEEAEYRFQVFEKNLQIINQLNKEHESTVFGVTVFSDLTAEEFMATISCVNNLTHVDPAPIPEIEAPATLDFRQQNLVTGVKNQGVPQSCGSCYIFASIADIEGQYAKIHQQLLPLSEQYPLDCGPFGCHGGDPGAVMNWLAQTNGAVPEQEYPYAAVKGQCKAAQPYVKVGPAQTYSGENTESIKNFLAGHGPLATVLTASAQLQHYVGGIFTPTDCGSDLNHAVTLVGYGENYWIIKNSWGPGWGEQGYFRIGFDHCNVGGHIFPSQVY